MMHIPQTPFTDIPSSVQLLSNGSYSVALNAAGSGYSTWRGLAVTRWRDDPVSDNWGSYLLLRDETNGAVWSASIQPLGHAADDYQALMSDDKVEIMRCDSLLTSALDVAIAADRDIELRRVTLTNHGATDRQISLTSYTELVLGPAGADAAHPAFSKMFIETEWLAQDQLLLATRRRRSLDEPTVWAAHLVAVEGRPTDVCEFETDRMHFLGRGRTLRNAQAMQPRTPLSNTCGYVLDPIFSLRQHVRVATGASVQLAFWTVLADSREAVLALVQSLRVSDSCEQVLASANARACAEQLRLNIDVAQAQRISVLASALIHANKGWRAPASLLECGRGGSPVLWSGGISGDRVIVLARIGKQVGLACLDELLLAQRYWQSKGLGTDVVVLDTSVSDDDLLHGMLQERIHEQDIQLKIAATTVAAAIFTLRDNTVSDTLRAGLNTVARIVLDTENGWPEPELDFEHARSDWPTPALSVNAVGNETITTDQHKASDATPIPTVREFDNGIGGFVDSGRAYSVTIDSNNGTPAPWVNVIANPFFGFMVSSEGGGYTWSLNSQQNPLTPWPNDPVSDTPHEVLYLRDVDSGEFWSATPLPIRVPDTTYNVVHGKGYSRFTHHAYGIDVALLQFVPCVDSVKVSRLSLHNGSTRIRHFSVTAYVEWALGANGTVPTQFVTTSIDDASGVLLARNSWRPEFAERVAFIDFGGRQTSYTGDKLEFVGRYCTVENPVALSLNGPLSGRIGAGLDPCGALQTTIVLAPNEHIHILFMLGDAASSDQACTLVEKYRTIDLDSVFAEVQTQWNSVLDTVQVHTPDRAMDILVNDWLLYQVLSCRVWARTAYYQASGAYGFRDQLQDVMALCVSRPDIAREHILRAAERQFVQGDVQHWWLPPSGRGIRTRISDDRIWLAYVLAHYIQTTADIDVLDVSLPFLEGAQIKAGDTDAFYQPSTTDKQASLYEHAARAIDSSLTLGRHGLPLIGTGDWNDGMNNVGAQGRGESVWVAWFLIGTIGAFLPLAKARGDNGRVNSWHNYVADLKIVLEGPLGWDGEWYRRGYYDDGTVLGSHESQECRIDTIAQSWSVMSGEADTAHARQAMVAVDKHLVRHDEKIALLFSPPFEHTALNPGYIKGYPPGIRENGGQYTHGASWSIFAYAKLGQGDQAAMLFDILNPIRHSSCPEALARYQVEPYVACADVYYVAPQVGRGGWTWYTGSAAWLYRGALEAILGFQLHGDQLVLRPCIPKSWPKYQITYHPRDASGAITPYEIIVENPSGVSCGVASLAIDGVNQADCGGDTATVGLIADGQTHIIRLILG